MVTVSPDPSSRRTQRASVALAWVFALLVGAVASIAIRDAIRWYGRPVPGVLVDPGGTVSSLGLPSWEGKRRGLHFPDRLEPAESTPIPGESRGAAWNRALERAKPR